MILKGMKRLPLTDLLKRAALPALCLMIMLYFGTHALFGPTGLLALDDIRKERFELEARHAVLASRKQAIEHDIHLLDPRGVDPDYADELVRRHLGVVRPDEVIVPLEPPAR